MRDQPVPLGGEAAFVSALPVVEEVVRFVARRRRCAPDEAEEFGSAAHLHLIDDDYRVLRRHQGRSSLRTYLVVVLDRLLVDLRRKRWGVWRPSAAARRLGPAAVRLDVLLHRDGMRLDEAVESLRAGPHADMDEVHLRDLAARLPSRPRRKEEGEGALEALSVAPTAVEAPLLERERSARRRALRTCLTRALAALPDEDALVLRLRFGQGVTVQSIAVSLGLEAKPLYRRIERLLLDLRRALEREGIGAAETSELIEQSAWDAGPELAFENAPSRSV